MQEAAKQNPPLGKKLDCGSRWSVARIASRLGLRGTGSSRTSSQGQPELEITSHPQVRTFAPANLTSPSEPMRRIEVDPFLNWPETESSLKYWIADRDIRLMAFYHGKVSYEEMVTRMPEWFDYLGSTLSGRLEIYRVNPNNLPPVREDLFKYGSHRVPGSVSRANGLQEAV